MSILQFRLGGSKKTALINAKKDSFINTKNCHAYIQLPKKKFLYISTRILSVDQRLLYIVYLQMRLGDERQSRLECLSTDTFCCLSTDKIRCLVTTINMCHYYKITRKRKGDRTDKHHKKTVY